MKIPEVKICGITNYEDAYLAAEQGAKYLGYILNYVASPRYIEVDIARDIIANIKQYYPNVKHVGVMVDASLEAVNNYSEQLQLDVMQLHGTESPEFVDMIDIPVWKTIEVHTVEDATKARQYLKAQGIVFDTGKGSGHAMDKQFAKTLITNNTLILAGGLHAENVVEYIKLVQPDIIDVSSGVESISGKKDAMKLKELFSVLL